MSPFFIDIDKNSNDQNFQIYKSLGDIYREDGDLGISCSLYEMALNYKPTDLSIRFRLAYDYAKIKKHAVSVYHYKLYLKTNDNASALNNLGVAYSHLKLPGKSVDSYKEAIEKTETLANANLASFYIENGFYHEAKDILDNAVAKKDHHENVDFYLNYLKTCIEREKKDEESLLKDVQNYRQFILDYAQAIAIPFGSYDSITGLWIIDYMDLKEIKIQFAPPNSLVGEHEFQHKLPNIDLAYAYKNKKISFSAKIINRGLKYSIKIFSDSQALLGSGLDTELIGLGFFSQDNQEIKFITEKEGNFNFFTAKKSIGY